MEIGIWGCWFRDPAGIGMDGDRCGADGMLDGVVGVANGDAECSGAEKRYGE